MKNTKKRFVCIVTYLLNKAESRPQVAHLILKATNEEEAYERGLRELVGNLNLPCGYLKYKAVEI